jgi:hypothetical protein
MGFTFPEPEAGPEYTGAELKAMGVQVRNVAPLRGQLRRDGQKGIYVPAILTALQNLRGHAGSFQSPAYNRLVAILDDENHRQAIEVLEYISRSWGNRTGGMSPAIANLVWPVLVEVWAILSARGDKKTPGSPSLRVRFNVMFFEKGQFASFQDVHLQTPMEANSIVSTALSLRGEETYEEWCGQDSFPPRTRVAQATSQGPTLEVGVQGAGQGPRRPEPPIFFSPYTAQPPGYPYAQHQHGYQQYGYPTQQWYPQPPVYILGQHQPWHQHQQHGQQQGYPYGAGDNIRKATSVRRRTPSCKVGGSLRIAPSGTRGTIRWEDVG